MKFKFLIFSILLALAKGTDKANKAIEKVLEITSKPALAFSQDSKLARAWNAARESIGKPASQEALALTNRLKIAARFMRADIKSAPTARQGLIKG